MAVYKFLSVDTLTGAVLAELPFDNVQYSSKLNDAGALTAGLRLPVDNLNLAAVFVDAVTPQRRSIYVDRDGVLVWGGIIWSHQYALDSEDLLLSVGELWSYFQRKRRIIDTKTYTTQDQLFIARDLINYAQGKPNGNLGVNVGTETSGVTRSATYNYYEYKPVGEAIRDLSKQQNGFDHAIDVTYAAGVIQKNLKLGYPRRGRAFNQSGFVFELGRNMTRVGLTVDGIASATTWYVLGAGQAANMLRSSTSRSDLLTGGYPLVEDTLSVKDIAAQSILDARAQSQATYQGAPVTLPQLEVRADVDPIFGSYLTGDECRVIVPPNVDPYYPSGFDNFYRIVGWQVGVTDGGTETVQLTLDQVWTS